VARIKDTSVEAVKAAANIVDLVEARTRLRKVGGRYTGLCPFHQEKTPSFSVSPDRGTYHCFGCGVGGDSISFVRETEGLDFVGAIEWLADRFHVPLEYEDSSPEADAKRRRRERLYALLEQAAAFYERVLWSESGQAVQEYLASRGLSEEACREFRLGLSPLGATLSNKAREKGFTREELAAAGLVTRRGSDYFQRRLMFPLTDARGRVIAFQARKLHEDDPLRGKYVNSPESELFHKSNVLYGLNLARGSITKEDRAIFVEGNTDVIALRQAGLLPVLASMGTALTEGQLKELGRLTRRVFLCFDNDTAGEDATLRGMELVIKYGFDVQVVVLDEKDPADDPAGFEERLGTAEPYAVYRVRLELDRARDKQHAYLQVQDILNGIRESPERHDAWRLANDRLGLTVQLRAAGSAATGAASSPRLIDAGERLERDALAGCVAYPRLVRFLAEMTPDHFDSELNRRVRAQLVEEGGEEDPELVARLAELDARAAADAIDEQTGKELLLRLRERKLRRELGEADLERTKELQEALEKVRAAVGELV
jgi:DNA primase